jgi:hypothetical protein
VRYIVIFWILQRVFSGIFTVSLNTSFIYYQSQESKDNCFGLGSVLFIRYIGQKEIPTLKSSSSEGDWA